jgi:hypothetical protein
MCHENHLLSVSPLLALAIIFLSMNDSIAAETATSAKPRLFEIRTYTIEPDKLPDTLKLFRNPVVDLFKKHGMTAIGYWVPADEPRSKDTIIYILAHDSRDAARKSWADFKADPAWTKARHAAQSSGKLFHKIETIFADPTDFSAITRSAPAAKVNAKERVFELRTYTTEPGKLPDLLKRFRNHTTKLFEKHGMTNIGYWVPSDEPRSKDTLIYLLAHDTREAAKKSWTGFRSDPDWIKVRDASEAPGKIVKKVESVFVTPTDFSNIK